MKMQDNRENNCVPSSFLGRKAKNKLYYYKNRKIFVLSFLFTLHFHFLCYLKNNLSFNVTLMFSTYISVRIILCPMYYVLKWIDI